VTFEGFGLFGPNLEFFEAVYGTPTVLKRDQKTKTLPKTLAKAKNVLDCFASLRLF